MFSFGIYKNKLYKTLFLFGIFIAMLLAALSGHFFLQQQKSSYLYYLSSSVSALETNSNVAVNLISRAVNDTFRNGSIIRWAQSKTSGEVYYHAIAALNQLKLITTDTSLVHYELAVITASSMDLSETSTGIVLKTTGTIGAKDFFIKKRS